MNESWNLKHTEKIPKKAILMFKSQKDVKNLFELKCALAPPVWIWHFLRCTFQLFPQHQRNFSHVVVNFLNNEKISIDRRCLSGVRWCRMKLHTSDIDDTFNRIICSLSLFLGRHWRWSACDSLNKNYRISCDLKLGENTLWFLFCMSLNEFFLIVCD